MATNISTQIQITEGIQLPVPVPLTEEQISSVLTRIPNPPGIGKSAVTIARKHIVERVRAVIEQVKIQPVPEAFEEFKEEIIKSLYESFIEPGSAVGVTAGVSLGGPVTQLSLNSFHFAGAQSGVALAFQKVRDFLTGSKMNRTPQMKVYFKVPFVGSDLHDTLHTGTFESIMSLRPEFEQTTVEDVVVDRPHILTREESEIAGVPQLVALHSRLRPERFGDAATKFPLTHVVELHLNTYRMYTHKITMSMVAKAIEGPAPPDALTCVWNSQIDGRMYILVDETRDYGQQAMDQYMAILMFLHREIIRKFGQWKISGITGIISIEPQEVNVLRGIYRVKPSTQNPGTHYVYTNNKKTRWDGVSLADINRLITAAGFRVRPISAKNKQGLYLIIEEYEGNLMKELEQRIKQANDIPKPERTPQHNELLSAASFHYAITNGTNMSEIVWRDDIDLFRTTSNHSHEVLDMLGIDAARIFLIYRFMQTLQDFSSYINPRHISLTFDLLCNLGIINSLSFVGINRRRIGPLAMASYERSLDVMLNASIFGDREAIVGVSPAIYVGQKSKRVGTGSVAIEEDLTVIPRDPPPLPTTDEDTVFDDLMIEDENVVEGTSFADLLANEDLTQTRAMGPVGPPGGVDKIRIQNTTKITNQPQPIVESIIPSSAQIIMASDTLVNALQKVTTGTGLIVEPERPTQNINESQVVPNIESLADITSLEDISGLTFAEPTRFHPSPPPPTVGILSTLQSIPTSGITIPLPGQVPVPSIIETIPLSPTYLPPRSPTGQVPFTPTGQVPFTPTGQVPLSPTGQVPNLSPQPTVRVPRPPIVRTEETAPPSPGSFLNLLPDLSTVTVPTSTQGNVQNVSGQGFYNLLMSLQQQPPQQQ